MDTTMTMINFKGQKCGERTDIIFLNSTRMASISTEIILVPVMVIPLEAGVLCGWDQPLMIHDLKCTVAPFLHLN